MKRMMAAGLVLLVSANGMAQSAADPFTSDIRRDYRAVRDYFVRAAEKMPENKYAFRPSPDVRTFAQQVAHVADDQYNLCSPAKGEQRKAPYTDIESRLSGKAELIAALKDAFAFCDTVYDAMTDAKGPEPSSGMKGRSKFSYLNWNLWHTWEHYGNVVVYLRMNGLVPPSSEKTTSPPPPAGAPPPT